MALPPLYSMEDYWACVREGNDFCTFKGSLASTTANNPIWDQIQANLSNRELFDRSLLHRAKCIPKEYSDNRGLQMKYAIEYIHKEIGHLNLNATIGHFTCMETNTLGIYDYAILFAFFGYCVFVTAVSIYDKWIVRRKNNNSIIWNFSVFQSWNRVVYAKNGGNYDKLKSIQGLRFFLMMFIIFIHTLLSYTFVYLDDPTQHEERFTVYKIFLLGAAHGVQPFFLISSWLCTLQIYTTYEDKGKFTLKDVAVNIINRYFRLVPSVAFMSILMSTNIPMLIAATPNIYYPTKVFHAACQNNMLPTLFFMNNYYTPRDMCDPVTWYLSADFQFYVLTTVIVYLILKYNWNVTTVVTTGIIATCCVYGLMIYVHNLEIIFRIQIRSIELAHFLDSIAFAKSYTATHASLTAPFLGIMFGFIYIKYRHVTTLHENKTLVALWYILFYGLLALTIYLTSIDFNPVISAILGPLLKPMYAFSFGVCILGISHNIGGLMKNILEMRFAEIMGKFCFGAYITHVAFCFTRGFMSYTLYPASRMETDFVLDLICSFISGILLSLTMEQPAWMLQKMIFPQIKKQPMVFEESGDHVISANGKSKIT